MKLFIRPERDIYNSNVVRDLLRSLIKGLVLKSCRVFALPPDSAVPLQRCQALPSLQLTNQFKPRATAAILTNPSYPSRSCFFTLVNADLNSLLIQCILSYHFVFSLGPGFLIAFFLEVDHHTIKLARS